MTKIVYNACSGGFSLSEVAMRRYAEIKGEPIYVGKYDSSYNIYWRVPLEERPGWGIVPPESFTWSDRDFDRTDPVLVQVVEELGDLANGRYANLKIRELLPGTRYRIDEYDGYESVITQDEYKWSVA